MSEHAPEVSSADVNVLSARIDDLADALEQERAARTEAEERAARAEVKDAREDLDETAAKLGLSRQQLESAVAAAKAAEDEERLRPLVRKILEEEAAEREEQDRLAAEEEAAAAAAAKPKRQPKAEPERDEDTEPIKPHWSERTVGDLVNR